MASVVDLLHHLLDLLISYTASPMLPAFRFVYQDFPVGETTERWKITRAGSSKHVAFLVFHIVQQRAVLPIIAFFLAGRELLQPARSKIVRS